MLRGIGVAFLGIVGLIAARASGDTLFYGGDPSQFMAGGYYNDSYSGHTGLYDERAYDDFTVPVGQAWTVTGFFAQISNPSYPTIEPLGEWEVRQGMSASSDGTLLASGTSTAASTTLADNGFDLNFSHGQTLTISLDQPVVLLGGQTYWFTLVPQELSAYTHMFVGMSADHANAVGGPLDNSSLYVDPVPIDRQTYTKDLSMGILGTAGPAPAVAAPLPSVAWGGLGLLAIVGSFQLARRRRAADLLAEN